MKRRSFLQWLAAWSVFAVLVREYFNQETPGLPQLTFSPPPDPPLDPSQDNENVPGNKPTPRILNKKKVDAIWLNLLTVRGIYDRVPLHPVPKTEKGRGKVASFNKETGEVSIEKEAIRLCESMGSQEAEAALAIILGHEAGHYLEWRSNKKFSANCAFAQVPDKDSGADQSREWVADLEGLITAYLCGYRVSDLLPKLIDRIYETYHLSDDLPGYYPKVERKKMATELNATLRQWVLLFEMANALTAMGEFKKAERIYQFMEDRYYPGREMYNNLGMAITLEGVQHYYTQKWILPFEQDWETRLKYWETQSETLAGERQKLEEALKNALKHLDRAVAIDANYYPARLNQMCVYFTLGNYTEVLRIYQDFDFELRYQSRQLDAASFQKAKLVRALALAGNGERGEATSLLESIKKVKGLSSSFQRIVQWNLDVLLSGPENVKLPDKPDGACNPVDDTAWNQYQVDFYDLPHRISYGGTTCSFRMEKKQDFLKIEDQETTLFLVREKGKNGAETPSPSCLRIVEANRGYFAADSTFALRYEGGRLKEKYQIIKRETNIQPD